MPAKSFHTLVCAALTGFLLLSPGCSIRDAATPNPVVSPSPQTTHWVEFGPKPADFPKGNGRISGRVAALLPLSDSIILLGSASGGIWRTEDGGTTWNNLTDFLTAPGSFSIGSFARDPNNAQVIYAGTGEINGVGIYGTGLLRSDDGGRSIVLDQSKTPPQPYIGSDCGVFTLVNSVWQPVGEGLPLTRIDDLQIQASTHRLAAGTHGRGMWEISLDPDSPDLFPPPAPEGAREAEPPADDPAGMAGEERRLRTAALRALAR